MIRKLAAPSIILAVLLALQAPAEAKGFQRAVIRGPGLATPVVIRFQAVGTLWSAAEYLPHEPHPYSPDLGPRYRVVFSFSDICPTSTGAVSVYLYPYASDGPELYTPPRQKSECGQRLSGGWAYGPASLLDMLATHGLPKRSSPAVPSSPAGTIPIGNRPVEREHERALAALVLIGIVLLGALIAGVRLLPRRRAGAAHE